MINWKQKEAIRVLYENGFTIAEISQLLNLSINTIKKYLTKK